MHDFYKSKPHKVIIDFLAVMFASKTITEKFENNVFYKIKLYNYRINIQEDLDLKDNYHFFGIHKNGEDIASGFGEVKYNIYYDIVNYLKNEGRI